MGDASGSVVFYQPYKYSSLSGLQGIGKMHGARRVIAFCLMTAVLPAFLLIMSLYLRHSRYTDVTYNVAESDVLEMSNGISTVFCQEHSLQMNSTFSAFQVTGIPKMSHTNRKHIQLKKSMTLPDDTLEYWGFYLPKGSTVNLSVCARYDGAHILVVKGDKVIHNCGPVAPGLHEAPHMAQGNGQVVINFEGSAHEIYHPGNPSHRNVPDSVNKGKSYDEFENQGGEVEDDNLVESILPTQLPELNGRKKRRHRTIRMKDQGNNQNIPDHINLRKRSLEYLLNSEKPTRVKRVAEGIPKAKLDGGIAHGGNAINFTKKTNDSSISSFEQNLLNCHDGNILLHKEFSASELCTGFSYLENNYSHIETNHEALNNGYYYYIFYSDNDFKDNTIYTKFDIYKPTFQYGNYSKGCINVTKCTFPVKMFSDDMVVVEVPTRDGIEHESDDITHLVSTCHPRTAVYAIFPLAVLFLILICAFL